MPGEAAAAHLIQFANASTPGGGTGTTSGGALNTTITAPALAFSVGAYLTVFGF